MSRDAERELAEDIRRTAGLMESVIDRARRLEVVTPGAVAACVDLWRAWVRTLDRRRRPKTPRLVPRAPPPALTGRGLSMPGCDHG
jgi:hypothetical protein